MGACPVGEAHGGRAGRQPLRAGGELTDQPALAKPRLAIALGAQLGDEIPCSSARDEGWRGLTNGALLARMVEHGFTILVTADRNLAYQQPLARLKLATVVVSRPLHRAALPARVAAIAEAVRSVQPGASIEVPAA